VLGPTTINNTNVPISFTLLLEAPLGESQVHYINKDGEEVTLDPDTFEPVEAPSTKCLGTAEAPTAEPGHLCIYTGFASAFIIAFPQAIYKAGSDSPGGASTAGARVAFAGISGPTQAGGTWAVTAEE
jgi:hypothetical protein